MLILADFVLLVLSNFIFATTPRSDERVKEANLCGIKKVDVKESEELIKKGAIFLDVREYTEYIAEHIPGALWTAKDLLDFRAYNWLI